MNVYVSSPAFTSRPGSLLTSHIDSLFHFHYTIFISLCKLTSLALNSILSDHQLCQCEVSTCYFGNAGHQLHVDTADYHTSSCIDTMEALAQWFFHIYHMFNIPKLYILPTQCSCVSCMVLTINSDFPPKQQ
jgi:hypothetical protein